MVIANSKELCPPVEKIKRRFHYGFRYLVSKH